MKDIQFNLEKWQTGEYDVFTRDNRDVTELTHFETAHSAFRLAGVVGGMVLLWTFEGSSLNKGIHENDLFLCPKVKTRWHNVWVDPDGLLFISPNGFDSKEEAKIGAAGSKSTNTYLKTIAVTNERE